MSVVEYFIWVIVFFIGFLCFDWKNINDNDEQSKRERLPNKNHKPSKNIGTRNKVTRSSARTDLGNLEASPEQRNLINEPYVFQCKEEVFTAHETEILRTYGVWLRALAAGKITPETPEQKNFVEECKAFRKLNLDEMLTFFEAKKESNIIQATWFKYICRIKFERENPTLTDTKVSVDWGWQGPPIVPNTSIYR